jgi:hypothetical protein
MLAISPSGVTHVTCGNIDGSQHRRPHDRSRYRRAPAAGEALLELHEPGDPPVCRNGLGRVVGHAGGIGRIRRSDGGQPSGGDSVGKPDNEGMTFDDLLTRVAQITAKVDVPVSVDIESGYGGTPSG